MIADYEAGMTGRQVAVKHGVWPNAVYGLLDRRGVNRRENMRSYKDGRTMKDGYVLRLVSRSGPFAKQMANGLCNGRYVLEHRLVMADAIGRPLRPDETVHHINGDRADNRLENLQLRQGQHGNGVCHRCLDCGSMNVEAVDLDAAGGD